MSEKIEIWNMTERKIIVRIKTYTQYKDMEVKREHLCQFPSNEIIKDKGRVMIEIYDKREEED